MENNQKNVYDVKYLASKKEKLKIEFISQDNPQMMANSFLLFNPPRITAFHIIHEQKLLPTFLLFIFPLSLSLPPLIKTR